MASTLSRDVLSSQKRIPPPRKETGIFPAVTCGFLKLGKLVRRDVNACTVALLQCVTKVIDIILLIHEYSCIILYTTLKCTANKFNH